MRRFDGGRFGNDDRDALGRDADRNARALLAALAVAAVLAALCYLPAALFLLLTATQ
jgi:hypothetical protein